MHLQIKTYIVQSVLPSIARCREKNEHSYTYEGYCNPATYVGDDVNCLYSEDKYLVCLSFIYISSIEEMRSIFHCLWSSIEENYKLSGLV